VLGGNEPRVSARHPAATAHECRAVGATRAA